MHSAECIVHSLLFRGSVRIFADGGKNTDQLLCLWADALKFCIGDVVCAVQKAEPVMGFAGFFQCDIHLCAKIRSALAPLGFGNVCTNTGAGSKKLLGHDKFFLLAAQILIQTHNTNRKFKTFFFNNGLIHGFHLTVHYALFTHPTTLMVTGISVLTMAFSPLAGS